MSAFNTKCSQTDPRAEQDLGPGSMIWLVLCSSQRLQAWGGRQLLLLTCLLAGRFKGLQTSPLQGTNAGLWGGWKGRAGELADLSSFSSEEKQLQDSTSLGIKEEKED